jgi:hypothetical protein
MTCVMAIVYVSSRTSYSGIVGFGIKANCVVDVPSCREMQTAMNGLSLTVRVSNEESCLDAQSNLDSIIHNLSRSIMPVFTVAYTHLATRLEKRIARFH